MAPLGGGLRGVKVGFVVGDHADGPRLGQRRRDGVGEDFQHGLIRGVLPRDVPPVFNACLDHAGILEPRGCVPVGERWQLLRDNGVEGS